MNHLRSQIATIKILQVKIMADRNEEIVVYNKNFIQKKIYTIRGMQVMLDEDLSILYGVETRRLNEQVKRNIERFPEKFMFRLSKEEYGNLMSQIAISKNCLDWESQFVIPKL